MDGSLRNSQQNKLLMIANTSTMSLQKKQQTRTMPMPQSTPKDPKETSKAAATKKRNVRLKRTFLPPIPEL